jgi:2-desacetyl-2-hydroxyethyl bacteriochlorophyllide A dehydrogenase
MSPATMQAAVARGARRIATERVTRPEPGAGEALVRVRACGVCGTDLHLFHLGALPPGGTPGHEIAGVVERLGPGPAAFAPGDAVAIEPLSSCGDCAPCRAGRDSICPDLQLFGVHRAGGMAEYLTVPAKRLHRVPQDLDARLAALAEPLAVAIHGLRRGGLAPGQRVLVLGAGSVGLLCVLAARHFGATDVRVSARHAHQAELARALGATRVLAESEATREALALRARSDGVELAIETVGGGADTLRAAVAALGPGGAVSVLGLFTGPVSVDPYPLLMKEASLHWSNCYARGGAAVSHGAAQSRADFADAIDLLGAERERLARVLTHAVPLAEIERAFALAADKKAGAIKVSVVP